MVANRVHIFQWSEIQERFRDSLIVGNGGSVAVHPGFAYPSLFEAAQRAGHLTAQVADVFGRFETNDFELVLRRLWQATLVNQALGVPAGIVEQAYHEVRAALIATIRDTHVTYEAALPSLLPIYRFMQRFRTVVSLNYDLIVYWAAMLGNREQDLIWFKDGFIDQRRFAEDWQSLREPMGRARGATLFFYPHGNLVLVRTDTGNEVKVAAGDTAKLLDAILTRWEQERSVPLFVCEGTSHEKLRSIGSSRYLQRVLGEPMRDLGDTLVIYGWAMSEQEQHILDRLRDSQFQNVAVSVHNNDMVFAMSAQQRLYSVGIENVMFFAADSPGAWNSADEHD